ncbi:LANO_0H10924g1_1 [Lachancea nothofagi CBS 11611]|uniref:Altered inheritance of mitochondria protein 24, mitochondrial n=1 Tax=Lachancea nothofagi CBS 11611 TaxID=1266666 RepID=A0A1G4KM84_9SACH|nr:LANO_0H10924g1_1 [Lachancea nothofagi CBS 11611]
MCIPGADQMLKTTLRHTQGCTGSVALRRLSGISNFTTTKSGTAGGPFSQLPEFTPLQDSILVSLPASCSLYTKTDKINAFTVNSKAANQQLIYHDVDPNSKFSKISTCEEPVNAMLVSSSPMSNVLVVGFDNYKEGWFLTKPQESLMCYSGDLSFQADQQLVGRGIVALCGEGPVYQLKLEEGETAILNPDAILGFNRHVRLEAAGFTSRTVLPGLIRNWVSRYAGNYLERFNVLWHKSFDKDKVYCQVTGPGTVLLQTSFMPAAKSYSDDEFSKAFK